MAAVRAIFEAFARGEGDLAYGTFDEEIVWDARPQPSFELSGIYRGHAGIRTYWRQWLEAWDSVEVIEGPRLQSHGSQVLSWWRQRNRGKGSGVSVEISAAIVWTFESGRVVRVSLFGSREEAFRAVGLEP